MTVRRGRSEYRALVIAAALIAPLLAAGCATPVTQLEWDTQRSNVKASAVIKPTPRPDYYASNRSNYWADNQYSKPHCKCDDVPTPNARPRPSWYQQTRPTQAEEASYPPSNSTHFQWPVRGRVVSDFGSYASGQRNDGINISAAYGEPIRAAGDGTVSYSGNELKSYGNLVLLRHDDGYVTAYAHAERFIVEKGDRVARGQVIGYVGSTGDVAGPQLHFELRRGARDPIDPRSLLGPQRVALR